MAEEIHLSSSTDSSRKKRPDKSALGFALARLARRAHSERELTAKMERAGYPPDEITVTLAKLRDWHYVDDRAYALALAAAAVAHKRWGPVRVARALRDKGLEECLIEEALSEAYRDGETDVIQHALARFQRTHRRRGTAKEQKARAYRHLLGRGFSAGEIMRVLGDEDFMREKDSS